MAQSASGDFIELGVFMGGSATILASAIKHHKAPCMLHLLDSWEGLPELEKQDQGTIGGQREFSKSSEVLVRGILESLQLLTVCETYPGWVEETLPNLPGPFSLAHIDLDLYQSTRFSLSCLLPKMTDDGVIIIDDYGNETSKRFPGVEKAVTEVIAGSAWHIVEAAGEFYHSVRLAQQA
jgi:O-methyltransferase